MPEPKGRLQRLLDLFVRIEEEPGGDLDPLLVVLCNCAPGESPMLAKTLVQEKHAACVNVIRGVTSYYVWQGKLEEEEEHTLLIKTTSERYEGLKRRLLELHSYSNPEIVALPTGDVTLEYLRWANEQTGAA